MSLAGDINQARIAEVTKDVCDCGHRHENKCKQCDCKKFHKNTDELHEQYRNRLRWDRRL